MSNAQFAHQQINGTLVEVGPCPDGAPGLDNMHWAGPCTEDWEELGWKPGEVGEFGAPATTRCVYSMEFTGDTGAPQSEWSFEAVATCDGDGDGRLATYRARALETPRIETADDVY